MALRDFPTKTPPKIGITAHGAPSVYLYADRNAGNIEGGNSTTRSFHVEIPQVGHKTQLPRPVRPTQTPNPNPKTPEQASGRYSFSQ